MAAEPYLTELDHALAPGSQIVVRAALVGDKFDINLSAGPDMVYRKSTGDDVALHITYSRGSRMIILNSFERGAWQREEQYNGSLIREQALFEIRVAVHPERFEIFVDNIKLADFHHRLPPQVVRNVYIVGDLSLQHVDVGNRSSRPTREARGGAHALEQVDPSILTPGNAITVRGSPTGAKFDINLSYGPDMVWQKNTGDNVALHVSYSGGSRRIILNSFENGHWGQEEQYDASSIRDGAVFEIRIVFDHGRFGIFLDGQRLADFNHRMPVERVQYVYVVGDINLQNLDLGGRSARQPRETRGAHALEKLDPAVLTPGHAIVVRGSPTGAKFDINLAYGPDMVWQKNTGDNVALHVSYSGGSRRIILNSFENGHWGHEEQYDAPSIRDGAVFEIRIVIDQGRFGIFLDNQQLAFFNYRLPLNQVHYIYVVGDINLQSLNTGASAGGQPQQPQQDQPRPPGPAPHPGSLPTPYRLKLPQNFTSGRKLTILGTPKQDAARFHVNLYAGHLNAFHNLVNFQEKTVYRDSRSKGEDWDKKAETDSKSGFPYTPGKQFQLVYAAEENAFQVYLDGVHHFTFKHRLPLNKINALGIEGNVQLHDVKFE